MPESKVMPAWGWLAILTLITRLPWFFPDMIDWDESTFMLMGASLVEGHLPYTQVWDNKPPLIFGVFAGLLKIPGHPVVVARIAAALCVLVVAVLIHTLGKRLADPRTALIAAAVFIIAMATTDSGQATTSDLLILPPLLGSVLLLVRMPSSLASLAGAGALLAVATLIRLNLGVVVVVCGVWVLLREWGNPAMALRASAAYVGGGLAVLALCALPYLVADQLPLFRYSVFEAPFRYASQQHGVLYTLVQTGANALGIRSGASVGERILGVALWAPAIPGLFILWKRLATQSAEWRRIASGVSLVALGTGISVVASGIPQVHYLIQLLPFAALFAAFAYVALATRGPAARVAVASGLVVASLVMLWPSALEYGSFLGRLANRQPLTYGVAVDLTAYLHPRCRQKCTAYLLDDHLAYTLLGVLPPRPIVTHPSNISKSFMLTAEIGAEATPELEMRAVLATRPDYIVKRPRVWYLLDTQARILDETIARDYHAVGQVRDRVIYERNDRRSGTDKSHSGKHS